MEFELRQDSEYIELIQLLKAMNIAESGAQAKAMVDDGLVEVNGEGENRKRAKLRRGDIVNVFDYSITIC